MHKNWRWFLPGYLMLLPMTIVGLLMCLLVYRATSWRWSGGCIECLGGDRIWFKPSAQTLGLVIVYDDSRSRGLAGLRVHERVHVMQGMLGGPLFAVAYVLSFVVFHVYRVLKGGSWKAWLPAYMKIPFEKQAYARQRRFVWAADKSWYWR